MAKAAVKKKVDPFKVRKAKVEESRESDTLTPPDEVQTAIDSFREFQEQARHFEGEATVQKDLILDWANGEFAKRALSGMGDSFKALGEESLVTYVVMDASAGLTEEDVSEFASNWGEKAAEELIERDYASVRFEGKVLEAHYDKIVEALQVLPPEVLEGLFKPMLMRARRGAVEKAKKYAKTPEKLQEMLKQLRMKNYLK